MFLQSVVFTNNRGFELGYLHDMPFPYVTKQLYENMDGSMDYQQDRYFYDKESAVLDFEQRAAEIERRFGVKEREGERAKEAPERYRYYSTQRPVDIGTFPNSPDNRPIEIFNYDKRILVENETLRAWGELIYEKPLTEKQMADYELQPAGKNPVRAARPSITAKLKEAAQKIKPPTPKRKREREAR